MDKEQEKAAQELKALADKSDLVKKAMEEARAEQVRKDAEKAAEVVKATEKANPQKKAA